MPRNGAGKESSSSSRSDFPVRSAELAYRLDSVSPCPTPIQYCRSRFEKHLIAEFRGRRVSCVFVRFVVQTGFAGRTAMQVHSGNRFARKTNKKKVTSIKITFFPCPSDPSEIYFNIFLFFTQRNRLCNRRLFDSFVSVILRCF